MKIVPHVTLSLVVIGFITPALLMLPAVSDAQTNASRATRIVTAHIPYDFWIEGTRLPAGDYTLSRVEETVVLFWNAKAKAEEQAFLMPVGTPDAPRERKLVFTVHNGQHYLREIWNSHGRQVITSQSYLPLAAGDTESEVRIVIRIADAEPEDDSSTSSSQACTIGSSARSICRR